MSATKQLIRRELVAREREFVATIVSPPKMLDLDQSVGVGAPTWVADITFGSNRPVKNVPIKASGSGARFFAQLNQTVLVRRTALGRLYIIGPGDRVAGTLRTTSYSLESGDPITAGDTGFTRLFQPFEFYKGPKAIKGTPTLTFAATGDTITRSAGSWLTDGFVATDSCRIARSILNDGLVTVSGTPTALVLTVVEALANEGPSSGITIGVVGTSLWSEAATFMPYSQLVDADGNPV